MSARYESTSRYRLTDNRREAEKKESDIVAYSVYTVSEGETLDRIAYALFGDPLRYWEIADINPQVKFPNRLSPGQVLRIPR
jgi:nucleoid-associated protein YgaU